MATETIHGLQLDPRESLASQWPDPSASYEEHLRFLGWGIDTIENRLVLYPGDKRAQLSYVLMASGAAQDGAVMTEGDPGSMKTVYGDMLLGSDNRTEVKSSQTEASLFGHASPVFGTDKMVPGMLKGISNPNDVRIWLNEVGHKGSDPEDILELYDTAVKMILGTAVRLDTGVYYSSTNFPNGGRVRNFDAAILSRQAVTMLTGDVTENMSTDIHNARDQKRTRRSPLSPLVPNGDVREAIHAYAMERHPDIRDGSIGRYTTDLISSLNQSGIIKPINAGDGRIGEGTRETARALKIFQDVYRLRAEERLKRTAVTPFEISRVAALCLPSLVKLNDEVRGSIEDFGLGGSRNILPVERAIVVRRHIARTAVGLYFSRYFAPSDDDPSKLQQLILARDSLESKYLAESTYANLEAMALGFDVDEQLDVALAAVAERRSKASEEDGQQESEESNGRIKNITKRFRRSSK